MLKTDDERHHVTVAMDQLSRTRVFLNPLQNHKLVQEASRKLEQALVCLALLTYSPDNRPGPAPAALFRE